jgi:hypothetical protein
MLLNIKTFLYFCRYFNKGTFVLFKFLLRCVFELKNIFNERNVFILYAIVCFYFYKL